MSQALIGMGHYIAPANNRISVNDYKMYSTDILDTLYKLTCLLGREALRVAHETSFTGHAVNAVGNLCRIIGFCWTDGKHGYLGAKRSSLLVEIDSPVVKGVVELEGAPGSGGPRL